jgi:hypothetical protein
MNFHHPHVRTNQWTYTSTGLLLIGRARNLWTFVSLFSPFPYFACELMYFLPASGFGTCFIRLDFSIASWSFLRGRSYTAWRGSSLFFFSYPLLYLFPNKSLCKYPVSSLEMILPIQSLQPHLPHRTGFESPHFNFGSWLRAPYYILDAGDPEST